LCNSDFVDPEGKIFLCRKKRRRLLLESRATGRHHGSAMPCPAGRTVAGFPLFEAIKKKIEKKKKRTEDCSQ